MAHQNSEGKTGLSIDKPFINNWGIQQMLNKHISCLNN